jgi:tetratricopeptide (TPR) repeat protein
MGAETILKEEKETISDKTKMIGLVAYTMGKDRGKLDRAIEICSKLVQIDPTNTDNYLYLGKLYLSANKKELAIRTFKSGLKIKRDERIISELKKMGIRKPPPFKSLHRDHKLNILFGKILRWVKLR